MCTIVAGKLNNQNFLFKNRDKKNYGSLKIIHEKIKNVECAYISDQTGWVEGMNEFGVGFVFAFLEKNDLSNEMYRMNWQAYYTPKTKINKNYEKKINDFKTILTFKTAKEAVEYIKKNPWNGNFFIGDVNEIYELECFLGEVKYQKVIFDKLTNFKVKTNHGILIPNAGHKKNSQSVSRASTEIRKIQAERYLLGFKNYTDLIKRMGFQYFDEKSSLNVFRTDDYEKTISQILLDLKEKVFNAIIFEDNSIFYGIENNLPINYTPKIKVLKRDKNEFDKDEFLNFVTKENDLYYIWSNIKHSKGERNNLK